MCRKSVYDICIPTGDRLQLPTIPKAENRNECVGSAMCRTNLGDKKDQKDFAADEPDLGLYLPYGENQERVLRISVCCARVSDPPDHKVGDHGTILSVQANGLCQARAAACRASSRGTRCGPSRTGRRVPRKASAPEGECPAQTPLNPPVGANANREGDLLGLQPLFSHCTEINSRSATTAAI